MTTPGVQAKGNGEWDSIHVFEANEGGRTTKYKLTSTVILQLSGNAMKDLGAMSLAGNLTRQQESDLPAANDAAQVANIGKVGLPVRLVLFTY